ncbi:hypothetical protein XELAEV_18003408mg [Xenopus laevis]|nr:hypothetical protein XELAEV_18003408mg [Xenopus laevis]
MLGPDTITGMKGSFDTFATGPDKTQDSNLQQSQEIHVEEEESQKTLPIVYDDDDDDDVILSLEAIPTELAEPPLEAIPREVAEPQETQEMEPQQQEETIHYEANPFHRSVKQLTATLSSSTAQYRKSQKEMKQALTLIHQDFMSLNGHKGHCA